MANSNGFVSTADRSSDESLSSSLLADGGTEDTAVDGFDATGWLDSLDIESIRGKGVLGRLLPGPYWIQNIIVTEACERYAYYSLRAVLTLYLYNELHFSTTAATSTSLYSQALAYFMPAVGGYISDTYWGKYKTIMRFAYIYILGSSVLSATTLGPYEWGAYLGLFLIALGTGGIKPCVSAFGADQFGGIYSAKVSKEQVDQEVTQFFHVFYFSINIGSVLSFFLSPLFRSYVGYWCAFGIPAVFLAIATYVFYRANEAYLKLEPQGSVLTPMARAIWVAFRQRHELRRPENAGRGLSWLDMARSDPRVADADVLNAKCFTKIVSIFTVMPAFWALFDQQSNAWVLQAAQMERHGIQPEQLNVLNPVLVLLFIPVFEKWIYPACKARNINFNEFRRIGVGMVLSVIAFLCSTWVSSQLADGRQLSVFAQLPQFFFISIAEILISITCLEFAYTQAPEAMKSLLTATWLITTGLGNVCAGVLWDALGPLMSNTDLNLLFAMLMAVNFIVFLFVANAFDPRPIMVVEAERSAQHGHINGGVAEMATLSGSAPEEVHAAGTHAL